VICYNVLTLWYECNGHARWRVAAVRTPWRPRTPLRQAQACHVRRRARCTALCLQQKPHRRRSRDRPSEGALAQGEGRCSREALGVRHFIFTFRLASVAGVQETLERIAREVRPLLPQAYT
jgi:hypothetical protein